MADKMSAVQMHDCISNVYIKFYFKWYSLLHFTVCQLLCWAFLFNLILCERRGVRAHRLLVINHYTARDWLPGVGQTAASL